MKINRCPKCNSPAPHLHPAVQFEGEFQPCNDNYHRILTPENTKQRVAETDALLSRIAK